MKMFKHARWAVGAAFAVYFGVMGHANAAPGGLSATGQGQPVVNDAAVSTGYQQLTIAAATGFTPPIGSQWCIVEVTAAVNYRSDGTNPTATVGMPLPIGGSITFRMSIANLTALRFIPQTGSATLNIDCYKDY